MAKTILALYYVLFLTGSRKDDTYHLARAIDGERPSLVCLYGAHDPVCQQLADDIGRVVLNRLDAKWCGSVQECVNTGFWGAADVEFPEPWAVESAMRVLESSRRSNHFYVFLIDDCDKLELEKEDATYTFSNGTFGFYFYDRHTRWQTKETS